MKNIIVSLFSLLLLVTSVEAQDYTSIGNGDWTSPSNWNNTSGWGTSTPPIDGLHGSGTITMNNNLSIPSSYNGGSAALTIAAGKTLTINGDFLSANAILNVNGTLIITGNTEFQGTVNLNNGGKITLGGDFKVKGGATLNINGTSTMTVAGNTIMNGFINVNPGGTFKANGNVNVNSSNFLKIGTAVAGPPYADFIVKGNLESFSSGDITINKNGRLAVGGSVNDNGGGGTIFDIKNGGQVYVDKNVVYSGGSSQINNSNSTSPYGLYVNGTVTNTGGGASTAANLTDKNTMISTNVPFSTWVSSSLGIALPVVWKAIAAKVSTDGVVVSWGTYSEKNNAYFEIERSVDGLTWSVVGTAQGSGTTEIETNYSFLDQSAEEGLNYYRVKQVDYDGQSDYSALAFVQLEAKEVISGLYPNPNAGTFTLQLASEEISSISIRTSQGIEVESSIIKNSAGYSVSLSQATVGFYTIYVVSKGKTSQAKFIVH